LVTNSEVLTAWLSNRTAEARNLSTDGYKLYSYALLIGQGKEVYDYTSKGLGFRSKTTSIHVGLAKEGVANG